MNMNQPLQQMEPLVTICMSVFNVEHTIGEAIESVLAQQYPRWELIIIDDASTDGTLDRAHEVGRDSRIKILSNPKNQGTYWNRNRALVLGHGDLFTTLDGDDIFHPTKLLVQVQSLREHVASLHYYERIHDRYEDERLVQIGHNTLMFRKCLVREIGYYDAVHFAGDEEYISRIAQRYEIQRLDEVLLYYRVRPGSLTEAQETGLQPNTAGYAVREHYLKAYMAWHRGTSEPYVHFPQLHRSFPVGHPEQLANRDPITVSLASFPARRETLRRVLQTILPWADRVCVSLNNYAEPPRFLDHPKIEVNLAEPDLGDRGKFWWAEVVHGYHFICDDDIEYSEAYAQLLISKIEHYNRGAIVSLHGSLLSPTYQDYYSEQDRNIFTFRDRREADTRVDFVGTGVMAYHTDAIKLSPQLFAENNMADVYLGIYAKHNGIPLICCASNGELVKDISIPGSESIYEHSLKNIDSKFNRRHLVNEVLRAKWA